MKTIIGAACMAIAAAGIVVGPAGVAASDPGLTGNYTFAVDLTQAVVLKDPKVMTSQWVLTSCGDGCTRVAVPGAAVIAGNDPGGEMHLVNGRWEMTQERTLMKCGAGSDITIFTSLDAVTLQGTQDTTNHCVGAMGSYSGPATLAPA